MKIATMVLFFIMNLISNLYGESQGTQNADNEKRPFLMKRNNVLTENPDLRARFLRRNFIADLEESSSCFFFMDGLYFNSNREQIQIDNKKIVIDSILTVSDILNRVGMNEWKGGQPQIKLIQENVIMQSPLIMRSSRDREDLKSLLNKKVFPGDIIYISRLQ